MKLILVEDFDAPVFSDRARETNSGRAGENPDRIFSAGNFSACRESVRRSSFP